MDQLEAGLVGRFYASPYLLECLVTSGTWLIRKTKKACTTSPRDATKSGRTAEQTRVPWPPLLLPLRFSGRAPRPTATTVTLHPPAGNHPPATSLLMVHRSPFYCTRPRSRPQVCTWWGRTANPSQPEDFCRFTVCFLGQNFEFYFLLAAVATPLLGMNFRTNFGLSIIPSKQQVMQAASGRTFSSPRQVHLLSLNPRVQRLPSPLSCPRYSSCSKNSRRCCGLAPLHAIVHHINTGSLPSVAAPGEAQCHRKRVSQTQKAGIIRHSNSPCAMCIPPAQKGRPLVSLQRLSLPQCHHIARQIYPLPNMQSLNDLGGLHCLLQN
jgi:hypothetical protein